ncbi:MAG: DUF192 domain-containing protein [Alphaproteobacteria bacterium]|nr:DUF192 domain-containing protein [Alphaproteobacteria bacterium]
MTRGVFSPIRASLMVVALLVAACDGASPSRGGETYPLTIVTETDRHRFNVEIADEPAERAVGLMHRTDIAADGGMLFVFPSAREVTFWMKDTPLSLDLVFIGADGRVHAIARGAKPNSEDRIVSPVPVKAVLEVLSGTTERLSINPGDRVETSALAVAAAP